MQTARDLMVSDLLVLSPSMGVHDAMLVFLDNAISGAPVVDEHGSVVGMLTERDCLEVIYRANYYKDPGGTVQEHMSSSVQTIDASASFAEVIEVFRQSRHRRFPVMDGTRLVGQISRRDILRKAIDLW